MAYFKLSCYWRRRTSFNVLLTLMDKVLLLKLFYLSQKSPIEVLPYFRIQKGMTKGKDAIIPPRLFSLLQRCEKTGSLQDRPGGGAARLSDARIKQLRKQTFDVNCPRVEYVAHEHYSNIFLCKYIGIRYPTWCVKLVPLQIAVTPRLLPRHC